jgi:hypothetical protein
MEGAALRSWPVGDRRCEQRSDGTMVEYGSMLAATRAFTADYDGWKVRIDTDTRVAAGHEIAAVSRLVHARDLRSPPAG